MKEFLLFTVHAPLASWGEIAVGEFRGSWDRPSRSAILGLLGAALGIEREDQTGHDALESGYGIAVRVDAAGAPMSDYHTAQTVAQSAVRKAQPRTRRELLRAADPETILSRRTYRQDVLGTIAVWVRNGVRQNARWTLRQLAKALERPAFVLYAGRKSNPLGLPAVPQVVPAATLRDALAQRPPLPLAAEGRASASADAVRRMLDRGIRGGAAWGREVSFDPIRPEVDGFSSGFERTVRRDLRRDVPSHRGRWQFTERVADVALTEEETAVVAAGGET